MIDADDACLNRNIDSCSKRVPLDSTRTWFSGARAGVFTCVTDGERFGWTETATLLAQDAPPATPPSAWLGSWKAAYGDTTITISRPKARGALRIKGSAEWQSHPDATPNVGELDGDVVAAGNELRLGDPKCLDREYGEGRSECLDCVARLVLINEKIFVNDNRMCGGMNVNFDGIYSRASKTPRKRR
jgi:hypothetical protein